MVFSLITVQGPSSELERILVPSSGYFFSSNIYSTPEIRSESPSDLYLRRKIEKTVANWIPSENVIAVIIFFICLQLFGRLFTYGSKNCRNLTKHGRIDSEHFSKVQIYQCA